MTASPTAPENPPSSSASSASYSSSVNTRIMLFAGVLTPAAVAVAWLIYFAMQTGWETLYGAALGGAFALGVHAVEHYLHTARHEALHGSMTEELHRERAAVPHRTNFAAVARAGAIMFTFLGITCEHLAKDLVQEMLRPCLISTISLLPVGMLFASAAERDSSRESNPFAILGIGATLGVVAAGLVSLVRLLAGLPVEFGGTFGWWALLGVGFSAIAVGRGHSLWRPIAAVVIAIAIVFTFAIFKPDSWGKPKPSPTVSLEAPRGNIFTTILGGVGYAVDKSLRNPDLPSRVWIEAKAEIDAHHAARHAIEKNIASEHHTETHYEASVWGSTVARWCGCKEPIAPTHEVAPASHEPPSSQAMKPVVRKPYGEIVIPGTQPAILPRSGSLAEALLHGKPTTRGLPQSMLSESDRMSIDQFSKSTIDGLTWESRLNTATRAIEEEYSRQKILCAELRQGFASGMIRSWIVMLLFAIGLGFTPIVEESLRPKDYPSSRTRRNDRILAWTLVAIVVGGAMIVRLTAP